MKFEHQFTVDLPADRVWSGLLDLERVASCLPGARIDPSLGDEVCRGEIAIKTGPMRVVYRGTARLADVDDDQHVASIEVRARERDGSGTASATIRNRVEALEPGRSRVFAETSLRLTGRIASMGGSILNDVAGGLMAEFARRFERSLTQQPSLPHAAAGAVGDGAAQMRPFGSEPTEIPAHELDLGHFAGPVLLRRAIPALGVAVLAIAAASLRRRQRVRAVLEFGGVRLALEVS